MDGSGNTEVLKRPKRPTRPKGSPMLMVLMTIVVLPSVLLADAWGPARRGSSAD